MVNQYTVKRPKIDVGLPIVCKACNTGWMSRLQIAVKPFIAPMIRGEPTTLDAGSCGTVAAWAAMSTMVAEHSGPDTLSIPQSDRTALFEHRECGARLNLPGWEIAIGRYVGGELDDPNHRRYRNWLSPASHCQATTLRVGELLIAAHSGVEQLPGLAELLARAPYQAALIRIHPTLRDCVWPPELWAHDVLTEDITFRIRKALAQGLREACPSIVAAGESISRSGGVF